MTQPVDSSILHEIVRVVEARRKVPERVQVRAREYLITYLDDHQHRLEEALQRYDSDRLNMLYGQLASKIKYQMLRKLPAASASARQPAKEQRQVVAKPKAKPKAAAPKLRPKAKPKPKTVKTASKKPATKRSAPSRTRATKAKSARGKSSKAVKQVAARKATPLRSAKRGNKRKPPKK